MRGCYAIADPGAGPDALGPGAAPGHSAAGARHNGRPPQSRRGASSATRPVGVSRRGHRQRHSPLRPRHRAGLGSAASSVDPPRRLGRLARIAATGGNGDPVRWTGCPAGRSRSRCGCGGPRPTPHQPMWTACGRRSCAASTSSPPSGCSNRPSAGPARRSAAPQAADRWTWLILAVYTQLRLARPSPRPAPALGKPAPPRRLTPARVRRGFRHLRAKTPIPGPCTKTVPARTGTPARPPKHTDDPPSRRLHRHRIDQRENHHEEIEDKEIHQPASTMHRLKIKLAYAWRLRPPTRLVQPSGETNPTSPTDVGM